MYSMYIHMYVCALYSRRLSYSNGNSCRVDIEYALHGWWDTLGNPPMSHTSPLYTNIFTYLFCRQNINRRATVPSSELFVL